MVRGFIYIVLVQLLGIGVFTTAARADDTGAWSADHRDTFRENLSATAADLRSPPRVYWKHGLHLDSQKGALAFHVGYEIQAEYTWYEGMPPSVVLAAGEQWESGFERRRSRIYVEGFFLRHWYFRVRYGIERIDEIEFADFFVEWDGLTRDGKQHLPTFRLGQIKEPMTMDWMNGSKWTTFAERGMFTTTIVPNRSLGLRAHGNGKDGRYTYQAGAFVVGFDELDEFNESDSGGAVTARVTALPWADKKDQSRLLHVGLSGTYRWGIQEKNFAAKAESALGPPVVATGDFLADNMYALAAECFYQCGRFSVLSEAAYAYIDLPHGQEAEYFGWYGQASYFLNGPGINYRRDMGAFGRIRPKCTILQPRKSRGWGAWEVAARASYVDLESGPFPGGSVWNFTLGLNWWARDNMRFLVNYLYTVVDNAYGDPAADGTMQAFICRWQWDL